MSAWQSHRYIAVLRVVRRIVPSGIFGSAVCQEMPKAAAKWGMISGFATSFGIFSYIGSSPRLCPSDRQDIACERHDAGAVDGGPNYSVAGIISSDVNFNPGIETGY